MKDPDLTFEDWAGMSVIRGATGRARGRPRTEGIRLSRQARSMRKKRAKRHIARPATIEELRKERLKLAEDALEFAEGQDREDILAWVKDL